MIKASDLNPDGCKNMAMACIKNECRKYAKALIKLEKNPEDKEAQGTVERQETFLRGNQYKLLCDIDPEYLIEKIRQNPHVVAARRNNMKVYEDE